MDEEDEETRLHKRKERKRSKPKLKHEQQKYQRIILKMAHEHSLKGRKYHFGMVIRIAGNGKMVLSSVSQLQTSSIWGKQHTKNIWGDC